MVNNQNNPYFYPDKILRTLSLIMFIGARIFLSLNNYFLLSSVIIIVLILFLGKKLLGPSKMLNLLIYLGLLFWTFAQRETYGTLLYLICLFSAMIILVYALMKYGTSDMHERVKIKSPIIHKIIFAAACVLSIALIYAGIKQKDSAFIIVAILVFIASYYIMIYSKRKK